MTTARASHCHTCDWVSVFQNPAEAITVSPARGVEVLQLPDTTLAGKIQISASVTSGERQHRACTRVLRLTWFVSELLP